jgi:Ferritin-like domain
MFWSCSGNVAIAIDLVCLGSLFLHTSQHQTVGKHLTCKMLVDCLVLYLRACVQLDAGVVCHRHLTRHCTGHDSFTVQVKDHMKEITSANIAHDDALAKILFADESEAAINQQINVEYTNCYLYHAMACYFGRDNVALHGFAAYFRDQSDDERGHAQMFMDFLSKRGGRVQLTSLSAPPCVRS